MKMIREEIEAALKYAELQLALSTNDTKTRCFRTIVLLLRAELSRVEDTMNEIQGWPDWKKRAALCNYKFGKEDTAEAARALAEPKGDAK